MATQSENVAHADLVNGSQTALHSHAGGGGVNVKSGKIAASGTGNSVTFNTAFSSTPQVVLTPEDASLNLRDALWIVRSVSTTGFTFDVDNDATYAWIATTAGNP